MAESATKSAASRNFNILSVGTLSDQQVLEMFATARWGADGTQVCPSCGSVRQHFVRRRRQQWRCRDCHRCFSVTSNTPLADHKLSLRQTLTILVKFNCDAKGAAIAETARTLGVSPKTAQMLLGKIREVLIRSADQAPLSGLVQIDGGYFGGKPRKANNRVLTENDRKRLALRAQAMAAGQKPPPPPKGSKANQHRRKSRRVVITIREVSPEQGVGALRTKVFIVPAETDKYVMPLVRQHVTDASTIWSDESPAYTGLSAYYQHAAVIHSQEFSRPDGVNENQAESYFSRLRRFEYGTSHRITPKYLKDYAQEMAWREDNRKVDALTRITQILRLVLRAPLSQWWRGYCQGNHRAGELLMV
jgi:transposase-like protein